MPDAQKIGTQSMMTQHADKSDGVQLYQDSYIEQFLSPYAEVLDDHDIPLMENERLLERINAHNLSMKRLWNKTLEKMT